MASVIATVLLGGATYKYILKKKDINSGIRQENGTNQIAVQTKLAIVEDSEIITEIDSFDAVFDSKDALQRMVYDIKDRPVMITGQEDQVIELFGVRFERIKVSYTLENLIVKKSR